MLSHLALYFALFSAGRIASWLIYQACWTNAIDRRIHPLGAFVTLLRKPTPWLFHLPVVAMTSPATWGDAPHLRIFAVVVAGLLAAGAIFRFGAADLGRFFVLDRLLALALAISVYFSPALLYPSVLASCALQYVVSGWKLGPGYSNLLGYEFIRGSASVLVACLAGFGLAVYLQLPVDGFEPLAFAVVMGYQASLYVNNALAKAALGESWWAWVLKNRLQCLVVNAWLRGWLAGWMTKSRVLRLAAAIGKVRILLCAAAFAVELGFLFLLSQREFALGLLAAAIVFHVAIFALTGLLSIEYGVNHAVLCLLVQRDELRGLFSLENLLASAGCIAAWSLWVAFIWTRIAGEFAATGEAQRFGRFGDAADLLMAWWDSPYMRMYSYSGRTVSGREAALPVTMFSPYDTALTDIHTHLMLLSAHPALDRQIEADRQFARSGVWGLVRSVAERNRLYAMMDDPATRPDGQGSTAPAAPWQCGASDEGPEAARPLFALLRGINEHQHCAWFQFVMRWPHFPGEDLVPDLCPLALRLERYALDEPLATVTITRIKTFYTDRDILVWEETPVGTFDLSRPPENTDDSARRSA